MKVEGSQRLRSIGSYAFAEVDNKVEELKAKGITPIDFGVGDPTAPTPEIVRRAAAAGLERRKSSGYPSYIGEAEFREAVSHGFAYSWWCGDVDCEAQIKEDTRATTRCVPLDQEPGKGKCIACGRDAVERAVFGRAY